MSKGRASSGLHELFDKVDEAVEGYVDLIAERIVQLGGIAEGTVRVAAPRSQLEEYPLTIADGMAHVEAVARALSTFGHEARRTINEADELDDADTADHVHRNFARHRQVALVCGSPFAGQNLERKL